MKKTEVSFSGIIKILPRKYAKSFIDDGTIMFNDADAWIKMEIENGKGQGDRFEGVYAACELNDALSILDNLKRFDDSKMQIVDNMVYFTRKSSVRKPAFCFYLMKHEMFNIEQYSGTQNVDGNIPKEYFQDFVLGKTADEVSQLKDDDKPSVIFIENYDEFARRIKDKLKRMGIAEEQFREFYVEYENKHVPFHLNGEAIGFLKFKDVSFAHQSEGRIILDIKDDYLINTIVRKPFNIGYLGDIAHKVDGHFSEGIRMEATVLVVESDK